MEGNHKFRKYENVCNIQLQSLKQVEKNGNNINIQVWNLKRMLEVT